MGRPTGEGRLSLADMVAKRIRELAAERGKQPAAILMHRSDVAALVGCTPGKLAALLTYAVENGTLRNVEGRTFWGIGPGRRPPRRPPREDLRNANISQQCARIVPAQHCSIPRAARNAPRSVFELGREA